MKLGLPRFGGFRGHGWSQALEEKSGCEDCENKLGHGVKVNVLCRL